MVGILKARIHNKKRLLFLVKQLVLSRFVLLDNELSHLTGHQVSAFCFIVIPSSRLNISFDILTQISLSCVSSPHWLLIWQLLLNQISNYGGNQRP